MPDFRIRESSANKIDPYQSVKEMNQSVGGQEDEDIESFDSFLTPVIRPDVSSAIQIEKKKEVKNDSQKAEKDGSNKPSNMKSDRGGAVKASKNDNVPDDHVADDFVNEVDDTFEKLNGHEFVQEKDAGLSNRFVDIYGFSEIPVDMQQQDELINLDFNKMKGISDENTREYDDAGLFSGMRTFSSDSEKVDSIEGDLNLDYQNLSQEERELVDAFVEEKTGSVTKEISDKQRDLSIPNEARKMVIQVDNGGKMGPSYIGGSPSLTPLPFMQQTTMAEAGNAEHDVMAHSPHSDGSAQVTVTSGKSDFDQSSSGKQNQMGFGSNPQDKTAGTMEQSKVVNTSLAQNYSIPEFISQIKEQFQRFQSGQDKKVTVHMREGKKNLTLLMQMNDSDGLDLIFRTTDTSWQDILQKNKQQIEDELASVNDGENTINIRYLGD